LLILSHKCKHPIATPFALLSLVAGVICLALARPAHPHAFTVLGAAGTVLLAVGVVGLLIPLFAWFCRAVARGVREIRDNIYIVRRGVPDPIWVRNEFIATTGREPTLAEVNDLHQLIESEYHHAMEKLVIVAGIVLGSVWLIHRTAHRTPASTTLSNVSSLQGRR
jgi:hypothetical protein